MRLSDSDRQTILATAKEIFGDVRVRLFGSRVHDDLKGGDIDLLIDSGSRVAETNRKALQLVARLQMRIGDQPIDVLVIGPDTRRQRIHDEAMRTGVLL